MHRIMTDN
jgi:chromosome segregation ATPase